MDEPDDAMPEVFHQAVGMVMGRHQIKPGVARFHMHEPALRGPR